MIKLREEVRSVTEKLIETRRDLHRHPELGFEEERTSSVVAKHLESLGCEVRTGVAKTGVMARIRGGRPGKRVLIRADMDALPIQEENDIPYRSENPGVMHACGHDGHTAIAMMAAQVLAAKREELPGEVILMFQPAEEVGGGAKPMIEAGALEEFPADVCLALHLWSLFPTGQIGVREGPVYANNDCFDIAVHGAGTHGAMPQLGVDTVLLAARVVEGLQSSLHRECSAVDPFVLSFGSIHGGASFNIIPNTVALQGTVRTYSAELHATLPERFKRTVKGIADSMGGRCDVDYRRMYPAVVNDAEITARVRETALKVVGEENVVCPDLSMGGEDMSFVQERIPGCYFFVGMGNERAQSNFPHHNPRFNIDEDALPIALETLLACTEELLEE